MKRILLIAAILALVMSTSAPAQFLFGKKKVNPSQRVPELILIVKTDPDERKRVQAAEELRDYDTKAFTEIVQVLADVLQNDKKHSVRLEALTSLARIRPVSTIAGQAIEKAAADDDNVRVRLQAKATLPKYHLAGYLSKKTEPASTPGKKGGTVEPPANVPPLPAPRVEDSRVPRPLPQLVTPPARTPPSKDGPALFPQ